MNSTTIESTDVPNNIPQGQSIVGFGFGYGSGLSLGVLSLIITISYTYYVFTRMRLRAANQSPSIDTTTTTIAATEKGLEEATLLRYPKLLYFEAKLHDRVSTGSGCSICLADYKDTDMLRLLPECGHLFHLKCIDHWLRLHPSCPICRNSQMPTPLATPIAEVVPLATQQS